MTLAVQVSVKKSDGTIYVVGGDDFDSFYANFISLFNSDTSLADAVLEDMARSFTPASAGGVSERQAVQNLHAAGVIAEPGFYTPQAGNGAQGPSQGRTAAFPVTVSAPYPERVAFKAAIDAAKAKDKPPWPKFDAAAKNWTLPPGIDLAPFAKWLPPGV